MQGMGKRLRARARALGLTDTEVARRLDMSQPRYAQYVSDANEPDLSTLVRICRVLDVGPDYVLGLKDADEVSELEAMQARATGAIKVMGPDRVRIAVALLDALNGVPSDAGSGKGAAPASTTPRRSPRR